MLKGIITMLFMGFVQTYAQDTQQKTVFNKGQQFEKITTGESTTTIQRGKQVLVMKISSQLTKLFSVTAVTDTGYSFSVVV